MQEMTLEEYQKAAEEKKAAFKAQFGSGGKAKKVMRRYTRLDPTKHVGKVLLKETLEASDFKSSWYLVESTRHRPSFAIAPGVLRPWIIHNPIFILDPHMAFV